MASDSESMQAAQIEIPDDIIRKILLPFSVKDLTRFRLVCKSWDSIISDPHFRKLHLDRSQQSPRLLAISDNGVFRSFDMKGTRIKEFRLLIESFEYTITTSILKMYSCSELVYFRSGPRNRIYVCNPTTKELLALPESYSRFSFHMSRGWGLGYVSSTKIYKVISILDKKCKVFAIGTDREWRASANLPVEMMFGVEILCFANGSLHIFCLGGILCFDLEREEWSVLELPQPLSNGDLFQQLTQLKGFLCIVQHVVEQSDYFNHLWFLQNNVWVKNYVLNTTIDPVFMENERILMKRYYQNDRAKIGNKVVWFDTNKNVCSWPFEPLPSGWEEMESLIDIHDVTVYVEGFYKLASS